MKLHGIVVIAVVIDLSLLSPFILASNDDETIRQPRGLATISCVTSEQRDHSDLRSAIQGESHTIKSNLQSLLSARLPSPNSATWISAVNKSLVTTFCVLETLSSMVTMEPAEKSKIDNILHQREPLRNATIDLLKCIVSDKCYRVVTARNASFQAACNRSSTQLHEASSILRLPDCNAKDNSTSSSGTKATDALKIGIMALTEIDGVVCNLLGSKFPLENNASAYGLCSLCETVPPLRLQTGTFGDEILVSLPALVVKLGQLMVTATSAEGNGVSDMIDVHSKMQTALTMVEIGRAANKLEVFQDNPRGFFRLDFAKTPANASAVMMKGVLERMGELANESTHELEMFANGFSDTLAFLVALSAQTKHSNDNQLQNTSRDYAWVTGEDGKCLKKANAPLTNFSSRFFFDSINGTSAFAERVRQSIRFLVGLETAPHLYDVKVKRNIAVILNAARNSGTKLDTSQIASAIVHMICELQAEIRSLTEHTKPIASILREASAVLEKSTHNQPTNGSFAQINESLHEIAWHLFASDALAGLMFFTANKFFAHAERFIHKEVAPMRSLLDNTNRARQTAEFCSLASSAYEATKFLVGDAKQTHTHLKDILLNSCKLFEQPLSSVKEACIREVEMYQWNKPMPAPKELPHPFK